jgi:hypothetical protein
MQYITRIIFAIIVGFLIILITLGFINLGTKAFASKLPEQISRLLTYKPYTFDINNFLLDPSDPNAFNTTQQHDYYFSGSDPTFCKELRKCIEMSIKGSGQCIISYKLKNCTAFNPDDIKSSISSCPNIDIKEELSGGIGRKICKFNNALIDTYNKISEDNFLLIDYEPYIHNCYLPEELKTNNIISGNPNQITYIYSGRGSDSGYDFKNGGTVRIVITKVSISNDPYATCAYSLYVCGQNAIAATETETPVYIFKTIMDIGEKQYNPELYYSELVVNEGNLYGYYPRPYEFTFSGTYANKEALIDAVDAGMWEWNKKNYENDKGYFSLNHIHFSYSPIIDIAESSTITFNTECWKRSYETYIDGRLDPSNPLSSSHIFRFSQDFNLNNRIKMVLGVKKLFYPEETKLVLDPITFCDDH